MKLLKKKYIIIISSVLAVLIAISAFLLSSDHGVELVDGDLYSPKAVLSAVDGKDAKPLEDTDAWQNACENDNFVLSVNTKNKEFTITDKRTGTIWRSGQDSSGETIPRNRNIMRNLLSVAYLENSETVETTVLAASSSDVTAEFSALESGIQIDFEFDMTGISVSLQILLDNTGFYAVIPEDGVKENGDGKIVSIDMLPAFGSKYGGSDAFFLYPDGCGVLYECKDSVSNGELYSANVYSEKVLDLDTVRNMAQSGQKRISLPYYGSADTQQGMISYVLSGAETARIVFSEGLPALPLNRIYASRSLRQKVTQVAEKGEREVWQNEREQGEFGVKYMLLECENATYSGMANALRAFLRETMVLPEKNTNADTVSVALDILMGTKYASLIGKTDVTLTSYDEAKNILNSLTEAGVKGFNAYLLGWQKDGYGELPTQTAVSSVLGGGAKLSSLLELDDAKNRRIILQTDYVNAKEGGNFGIQSDIVHNFVGEVVTDSAEKSFLLNPYRQLKKFKDDLKQYKKIGTSALAFDSMSSWLPADYSSNHTVSFGNAANAYSSILMHSKNAGNYNAVQGANSYLLYHSDTLYDVCDDSSHLLIFNKKIPFLQIVLHGVVPYSCATPGNMASDFNTIKLNWAEYGAMPYFIITESTADGFEDTEIDDVFSTCFKDWEKTVIDTAKEFSDSFSHLVSQNIISHENINDEVVCVTYENGDRVVVNYGENPFDIYGTQIGAMNYTVIPNKG